MIFGYLILSRSLFAQLAASVVPTCGLILTGTSREF
jgi:hypothetical protein